MRNAQSYGGGGISIFTAIGIVLVILKLTNNIELDWFWVIAPFWMPAAAFIALMILIYVGCLIAAGIQHSYQRFTWKREAKLRDRASK